MGEWGGGCDDCVRRVGWSRYLKSVKCRRSRLLAISAWGICQMERQTKVVGHTTRTSELAKKVGHAHANWRLGGTRQLQLRTPRASGRAHAAAPLALHSIDQNCQALATTSPSGAFVRRATHTSTCSCPAAAACLTWGVQAECHDRRRHSLSIRSSVVAGCREALREALTRSTTQCWLAPPRRTRATVDVPR